MLYLGLIFSVISLLCVVDHTALSASTKENGVIQLTPENFEETLKQSANLLVVYIAPWCGHCKTLMPDLMRVATRLKHKKVNVSLLAHRQ